MFNQSLNGAWSFRQSGSADWLPAHVPGGVHTDLLALGKIPDPFIADNEKQVQWVAEVDWEYRSTFQAQDGLFTEGERWLVCDGLDTLADVWLNGTLVGKANNMYRRWEWNVSGILVNGENELKIFFRAPVAYIRARQSEKPLVGGGDIPGGPHLRKAPCQWGWDWGPKLPPIGIWKDIYLESFSQARFKDVHVRQRRQAGKFIVSAQASLHTLNSGPFFVSVCLTSPSGVQLKAVGGVQRGQANLEISVPHPQLWWPNGYGAQPLYSLEVTLQTENSILDQRTYNLGLRQIELRREPDAWGESFTFFVNDVPIFAKGADWIPADSFPTRLTIQHFEKLLSSAVTAHMNMLRVWGGGLYEDDRFYDLCDRMGILIWQDFTFACGIYPEDDYFAENVRIEAVENVRRLRHHASLALWCGNNEMEQGWADWGWNQPAHALNQSLKAGYDRLFHHLLPAVVAAEDPDTPYWPSSASSGIPFAQPNGDQRGDMHYWEVWHSRKPFTAYRTQYPRFMSEFGFQALPTYPTVQTYASPQDQNMTSYIMEHHQRSGSGNGLIIAQMTDTFRMPRDFRSLVYLSMVLQAEGIRYGVEHWRRNRARVSGTLYWQLNDCWPVASWSSLDYYGRWKALHYAARRFYAPVMLSIEDVGKVMAVHVTSDLTTGWHGQLAWRLENLAGEILASGAEEVLAAPLANTAVTSVDFTELVSDANLRRTIFVCELSRQSETIATNIATFAPNKHLELTDPDIETNLSVRNGKISIHLKASSLARFVELSLEGADVIFSDNYFDLPAQRERTITAQLPAGWTSEQAKSALRVTSLYDSF